jgi:squalene-hopene/tetraprenyl-beta-curcumene cyclase
LEGDLGSDRVGFRPVLNSASPLFTACDFFYSFRVEAPNSRSARWVNARNVCVQALLAQRDPGGFWVGELSTSALSTATASFALSIFQRVIDCSKISAEERERIQLASRRGLEWLSRNANNDGGWGDTLKSFSNLSTTVLCWAAFQGGGELTDETRRSLNGAEKWIAARVGSLLPKKVGRAVAKRYGKDRTFAAPILTMCALACGVSGLGAQSKQFWKQVPYLPFELATLPQSWFAFLRLPVVSYALPALIAIGQVKLRRDPPKSPLLARFRKSSWKPALKVLESIQPSSGGFLEATPLTSFVLMSLAGSGEAEGPVARKCLEFLLTAQRADGSWPIDSNLSTWVSTLSVHALAGGGTASALPSEDKGNLCRWLLAQQYHRKHPYTGAEPGGWAWTPLPGGVPDADDTAGALLALSELESEKPPRQSNDIPLGLQWLLRLQNSDGGIPTFCRGWGHLPFDRSSPDLTAHALRAWLRWRSSSAGSLQRRLDRGAKKALDFLARSQAPNGSWTPLWFGNQHHPNDENPTYGTTRVLVALAEAFTAPSLKADQARVRRMMESAASWLIATQLESGAWNGAPGAPATVEETAWTVEALIAFGQALGNSSSSYLASGSWRRGADWLVARVEDGSWRDPSPVGFYFARLWYFERLYPLIFSTATLTRACAALNLSVPAGTPPPAGKSDAERGLEVDAGAVR